jgi:hypothetical protein
MVQFLPGVQMPSPVHPYSDYGVALRTLKSSRSWLVFVIFACAVAQFIGFALMWWTPQPYERMKPEYRTEVGLSISAGGVTASVGKPAVPEEGRKLNIRQGKWGWEWWYTMLVAVTQLASVIAVSSQAIIVFVTLLVMLVAQAPGVAQMTRCLNWSVLLLFAFLPWQYFARDFPIPGVIYGYTELIRLIGPYVVSDAGGDQVWQVYGRFVGWPLVGMLMLLISTERYRAGVMIAIGHPLQSMLQPRGAGGAGMPPPPVPPPPGSVPALKSRHVVGR